MESPITATVITAATIHPDFLLASNRRTVSQRCCFLIEVEADESGEGTGGVSAELTPSGLSATNGSDVVPASGLAQCISLVPVDSESRIKVLHFLKSLYRSSQLYLYGPYNCLKKWL
jgi:hypothetical protein